MDEARTKTKNTVMIHASELREGHTLVRRFADGRAEEHELVWAEIDYVHACVVVSADDGWTTTVGVFEVVEVVASEVDF